jgi:pimeloyl-ACP methyl ester carboxylesterase
MKVSDALLNAAREDEPRAFDLVNYWSHHEINARPGCPAPGFSIFVQNRRLMERQRPGVLYTDLHACHAWSGGPARADALRCPVLFVLARHDSMTPPRSARELVERARAAAQAAGVAAPQVVDVPDCGHAIMSERPDVLLAALRGFIPAPAPATLPA